MLLPLGLAALPLKAEEVRFQRSDQQMGTRFSILLYAKSEQQAKSATDAAFARIRQLNEILSDYRPDSELSQLSRSGVAKKTVTVSEDLWAVLSRGQQLTRLTDGAFDMTLGPVTTLWRAARQKRAFPDQRLLDQARQAIGAQHLVLSPANRSICFQQPNMRLDLGGIAKGFALDQAMIAIKGEGITRALIDGGGDLLVSAPPPNSKGWRIGLTGLQDQQSPSKFVWLANRAIATSGDLRQYVEINGVRYSHLIDPKTGVGLTNSSLVTVIAPTAIDADAVASAVSVLGPIDGFKLLKSQDGQEGRIVYRQDGVPRLLMTSQFATLVDSRPLIEAD
ncbi:MAG: FAD:protein FMN transferase [Pirellulaceae bacterium]|nr:FAD:protein FMN transferase [Pirellulaceae bacterium]